METTQLASQNPLSLVSFLLVEFQKLERIEQVYEKLGETGFLDISSDQDSVEQWTMLGLSEHDNPYLLKLCSGHCTGEMELIFSDDRLVQAGLRLSGDSSQTSFCIRLV